MNEPHPADTQLDCILRVGAQFDRLRLEKGIWCGLTLASWAWFGLYAWLH